jgi:hypothetical protein
MYNTSNILGFHDLKELVESQILHCLLRMTGFINPSTHVSQVRTF